MNIFESLLTTFEVSVAFWGSWGSCENSLKLEAKPPQANLTKLSMPKFVKHFVYCNGDLILGSRLFLLSFTKVNSKCFIHSVFQF